MNIDKQDERLLHEILSKYKQGLISGLIQGNNVTFTSTGCRNKVISSTGGGGDFDLYEETTNYPLADPDTLTGDEVFFIAGDEGSTLSLNAIIAAVVNISSHAFYEKEQVNVSRAFQSSDKNKILYIGADTRLTVAEGITFDNGDIIGVSYSIDSPDSSSGFNIVPDGHLIFPYCSMDSIPNEVVYLSALNIEGQTVLIPISTFIKITDDINNEAKTGLRYLMDNSSGTIPLTGTESGHPVTGDIEVFNGFDLKTPNASANEFHSLYMDDGGIQLKYNNSSVANSFIAEDDGFSITSDNASFRGFKGDADYSAAYQVNDYTQLVYVGYRGTATLVSGTITVNTTSIKTGYKIYVSVNTPSGTQGFLSAPTGSIVNEISFVINSSSVLDNSTVNWWITP